MARHVFTKEDRQKGFRHAVRSLRTRYNMRPEQAARFLFGRPARQTGTGTSWSTARQARLNGI